MHFLSADCSLTFDLCFYGSQVESVFRSVRIEMFIALYNPKRMSPLGSGPFREAKRFSDGHGAINISSLRDVLLSPTDQSTSTEIKMGSSCAAHNINFEEPVIDSDSLA